MSYIVEDDRIYFETIGIPVAKGRAKTVVRGKFAAHYTPEKTRQAEQSVLAQALPYKPAIPWEGAVGMKIVAVFPIPASYSNKRRQAILNGEEFYTKKPDEDNVKKMVNDALNGVFFRDDAQIVNSQVDKVYGEVPMIRVWLWKYSKERRRFGNE